jgi:hypothetical protein
MRIAVVVEEAEEEQHRILDILVATEIDRSATVLLLPPVKAITPLAVSDVERRRRIR